jgi:hypothetical protein
MHVESHKLDFEKKNPAPTELEVRQAIARLKNGKSPGPDGIPAEFYKAAVDEVAPELTLLIGKVWDKRVGPKSGKSPIWPQSTRKGTRRSAVITAVSH